MTIPLFAARGETVLLVGPTKSGKTKTAAAAVTAFLEADQTAPVFIFQKSTVEPWPDTVTIGRSAADYVRWADQNIGAAGDRSGAVVIDDALLDPAVAYLIADHAANRDNAVVVVAQADRRGLRRSEWGPLLDTCAYVWETHPGEPAAIRLVLPA